VLGLAVAYGGSRSSWQASRERSLMPVVPLRRTEE